MESSSLSRRARFSDRAPLTLPDGAVNSSSGILWVVHYVWASIRPIYPPLLFSQPDDDRRSGAFAFLATRVYISEHLSTFRTLFSGSLHLKKVFWALKKYFNKKIFFHDFKNFDEKSVKLIRFCQIIWTNFWEIRETTKIQLFPNTVIFCWGTKICSHTLMSTEPSARW